MIDLTLHTPQTAPEGSREVLVGLEQKLGFVPNILRQMAASPAALGGAAQLLGLLEASSLTPTEQQVILLEVARQSSARYCVAANSSIAQMKTVSPDVIQRIRQGEPLADPRLEALRFFVAEMVRERGHASKEATEALLAAGFEETQILDIILGIATETLASFTDRMASVPLDDQFQRNTFGVDRLIELGELGPRGSGEATPQPAQAPASLTTFPRSPPPGVC
jgi:alkylhydroperoxidase family enzyme